MDPVITANQVQIAAERKEVMQAQIQQAAQQKIVQLAQDTQNTMDELAKAVTEPIKEVLQLLKKITAKLNNVVDMNVTWSMVTEKMGDVKSQAGQIADKIGDMANGALDSLDQQFDNFIMPEDSSIVQDVAGDLLNATIKAGFDAIKAPVKTIENIAPVTPLSEPLNAVTDALDGLCKIATTDIPDAQLDAMLARKVSMDALLQSEKEKLLNAKDQLTDTATSTMEKVKNGVADMYSQAKEKAGEVKDNIVASTKGIAAGLEGGIKQSWKNFRCPEMPPGIQTTLDDFIKAVMHVCANIQSVAITVLFKLVEQIFDCLNQILGVLGVPEIPDPLGSIPKIVPDVIAIFTFITNLPISLVKLAKAIIKKKVKEMSIMMDPPASIPPMKVEPEVEAESHGCGGGGGGGCGGGGSKNPPKWKVTFNADGNVVNEQEVEDGQAASDPGPQSKFSASKSGYWQFKGWSEDFSCVMSNLTIDAQFDWVDYPADQAQVKAMN